METKYKKVYVDIGYYEITIRPFNAEFDFPGRYSGCGGLFSGRRNLFRNFTSCMNYLERNKFKFDDTINISLEYSDAMCERYPLIMDTFYENYDDRVEYISITSFTLINK